MKSENQDWVWLSLMIGSAGLVGLINLLPSGADGTGIREWVSALGGWVAALVALPSLIILLKQTDAAEAQLELSRMQVLEARIAAVREEHKMGTRILKDIDRKSRSSLPPFVNQTDAARADELIEFCDIMISELSAAVGQISNTLIYNPTTLLKNERTSVADSLIEEIKRLRKTRRDLGDAKRELLGVKTKRGFSVGIPPDEYIAYSDSNLSDFADLETIRPIMKNWHQTLLALIEQDQKKIDKVLRSH